MLIVDHYFRLKQGQVWVEIQRDIEQIGILPLRIDGEMIALMIQSHLHRSMFIKTRQEAILKESRDADIREEKATYKEIIESTLAPTLDAFHEVDYIARTTNPRFMRQRKQNQTAEVERSLKFPDNVEPQLWHRTYLRDTNVTVRILEDFLMGYIDSNYNEKKNRNTLWFHQIDLLLKSKQAIMNHQHTIHSESGMHATESGEYELAPVSSSDAGFGVSSSATVEAARDAPPCRACFASGLPCFHH